MRLSARFLPVLYSLIFISAAAAAENQSIYFRHLGVTEGLTNNCISSIVQDSRGTLWIGTNDGLNRFDGGNVRTYKNGDRLSGNLPNNAVTSLFVDKEGILWVGTSEGLSKYLPGEDRFVPIQGISGFVHTITQDSGGRIWSAIGEESVVTCFDNKTGQVDTFNLNKTAVGKYAIHGIAVEESGTIWIGTFGNGLFFSKDSLQTLIPFSDPRTGEFQFEQDCINFLKDYGDGYLYVGSFHNGASAIAIENHNMANIISSDDYGKPLICRSILKTKEGKILVGGESGLHIIDNGEITHMTRLYSDNSSLSDNAIYSLYQDNDEGIWVGSFFGGVDYSLSPFSQFSRYHPTQKGCKLVGKRIREFCEDDNGTIWIGTEDSGLNCFNPKTNQFSYLDESKDFSNIHGLCMVDGKLWVGTYDNGIRIIDPKTKKIVRSFVKGVNSPSLADNCIFTILKSKDGDVFIGTYFGIQKYDRQNDCFSRIGPELFAYYLKLDSQGNLWGASYHEGLFKINTETGDYQVFKVPEIPSNQIRSIFEDSEKTLWILTEGGGFCQYDQQSESFKSFNTSNGLPCDIALRMEESEDGTLWISTTVGLLSFKKSTSEFRLFTIEDGLPSNQFNYQSSYKAKDGKLYFGSIEGFISFYPSLLTKKEIVPSAYVSDIKVGGKMIPIGEEGIVLDANHGSISISAILSSLHKSDSWTIEYQMSGLEKEWINLKQSHIINYNNLNPGKYTFTIRAISSSNEEKILASLPLTILPYWYQTLWAQILFLTLILLATFCALRIIKWKNYNNYLLRLAEMRRASEEELFETKLSFYTDVAHEIKTPVTLINGPLDDILNKGIRDKEIEEDLLLIKKSSNKLTDLVNQLLDFRKIEKTGYKLNLSVFNISPIITDIVKSFSRQAEENGIRISISLPEQDVMAEIDQELFSKIITNMVSNGVKYSSTFLEIILETDSDTDSFSVTSINDGDVIPPNMREDIFKPFVRYHKPDSKIIPGTGIGLILARTLAENHKGSLTIKESQEKNIFVLKMPLRQNKDLPIQDLPTVKGQPNENTKTSVLIVEDNIDMLVFIKRELIKEYAVFEARNGIEALSILESQYITIIISDLMMPLMDGTSLCHAVKTDIRFSHIPFILFTANNSNSSKIEALSAGVDSYIEKPFNIEYLKASIQSLLQNREALKRIYSQKPLATVSQMATNEADEQFLNKLNEIIAKNYSNPEFRLEEISDMMNMSKSNFYRKIKGVMDMTPNDLLKIERLKKAAELLQQKRYRISEICYMVGFSSPSYFDRCFQKQFGLTPKDYLSKY